ncbi:hypothetical protein OS493_014195 [Desmophyllum pertusum]|uniref:Uncharacterized protein n=1 Tax=Desmophyllum pertusum TaxID=174260 RepID=A0A9X0CTN2_9CNID|nr:hypothetical protein OS493_014195 [Desmophyllum pertusum]
MISIGLAVSVASAIQGAVCTFTDVCGGDEVTNKLAELEKKLDAIQSDVTSIKKDVEDIWDESKRKWYFKHIEYIVNERKKVMRDLKNEDNSALAKDRRNRFINEVVGGAGKRRTQNGKSTKEAARLTWIFIKKLFRYQEDGYATVVLATSMKYKNDEASFNSSMAQVCTWWPKSRDPEYEKFCANFVKDPESQERRKLQQDFLFGLRDLALVPVQLVQTDCSKFKDSDTLLYSAGYIFVAQPVAKKILVVNRETLDIVKTISIPGSECGGSCHPFGIAINAENKVLAVAAQSKTSRGDSKVMMFKIKGNLDEPSGISIEHYYTMFQLMHPAGISKPDVRGVAFCGERFAYADYNGMIYNWRMTRRWGDSNPEPNLWDRYDWDLDRVRNTFRGKIYYLGCSNSGKNWVVEKTNYGASSDGVGAVPSDSTARNTDKVLDIAEVVVKKEDWYDVQDGRSRMGLLKGTAMDTKRNLFYSSGQRFYNSVSGVYQRTYDGKRRYVREWNKESKVKMFGMAVDDSGFLFSVQKDGSGSKCLHKYDHEIDLEDINVP